MMKSFFFPRDERKLITIYHSLCRHMMTVYTWRIKVFVKLLLCVSNMYILLYNVSVEYYDGSTLGTMGVQTNQFHNWNQNDHQMIIRLSFCHMNQMWAIKIRECIQSNFDFDWILIKLIFDVCSIKMTMVKYLYKLLKKKCNNPKH